VWATEGGVEGRRSSLYEMPLDECGGAGEREREQGREVGQSSKSNC